MCGNSVGGTKIPDFVFNYFISFTIVVWWMFCCLQNDRRWSKAGKWRKSRRSTSRRSERTWITEGGRNLGQCSRSYCQFWQSYGHWATRTPRCASHSSWRTKNCHHSSQRSGTWTWRRSQSLQRCEYRVSFGVERWWGSTSNLKSIEDDEVRLRVCSECIVAMDGNRATSSDCRRLYEI